MCILVSAPNHLLTNLFTERIRILDRQHHWQAGGLAVNSCCCAEGREQLKAKVRGGREPVTPATHSRAQPWPQTQVRQTKVPSLITPLCKDSKDFNLGKPNIPLWPFLSCVHFQDQSMHVKLRPAGHKWGMRPAGRGSNMLECRGLRRLYGQSS